MSKIKTSAGMLSVVVSMMLGCSQSETPPNGVSQSATPPDATYLLAEKPSNSQGVAEARKNESGSEEITIEGRIGGSEKPFVDGIAAFTIVDPAIPYCAPDEGCPTPWDYCCNTDKLKDNSALIKIVQADGEPVSKDARELLGVKELSRVIIRGKAQRDKEGNLTVLAEKVHITKE
ncbi:MAG: OB-fold nucleic acid binding domain-containing protein [Planctomycetaceae bacterium]